MCVCGGGIHTRVSVPGWWVEATMKLVGWHTLLRLLAESMCSALSAASTPPPMHTHTTHPRMYTVTGVLTCPISTPACDSNMEPSL